jgi:uncharacterized membrane protein
VAIVIGMAFIAGGWIVYDVLCRSPLGRDSRALGAVLAVLLSAAAWVQCHLFSGRGAYMEFGAMLGTIMVANVFFVIIPAQRALVRIKQENREPDPTGAIAAKLRSTHNTYFTLPVLFVMISNHYAMTYGARYNWLVLLALSMAGACVRAWFVARHRPEGRQGAMAAAPMGVAVLSVAAAVYALAPAGTMRGAAFMSPPLVEDARAQSIVTQRCVPCHSNAPTQVGFAAPPNGLVFQTLDQLNAHLPEVQQQLTMHTMPLGNLTMMTDEERGELLMWIGHRQH